jgi:hypothetical protein
VELRQILGIFKARRPARFGRERTLREILARDEPFLRLPSQGRSTPSLTVILLLLLVFVGLATLVFFVLPDVLITSASVRVASRRLQLRNDVRTTGVQLLGGTALVLGVYFTARSLSVNREYQISDRYSKAIEQIGHEALQVRLGGIYGLDLIARQSRADYDAVISVLCAFIRVRAGAGDDGSARDEDVAAALLVVAHRNISHERGRYVEIDLSEADLAGANLRNAQLAGAWILRSNLRTAWLGAASLVNAQLVGSNLDGAFLVGADLRGAGLKSASMRSAHLEITDLRGTDLSETALDGAALAGCRYDATTVWPPGFDLGAALERLGPEPLLEEDHNPAEAEDVARLGNQEGRSAEDELDAER